MWHRKAPSGQDTPAPKATVTAAVRNKNKEEAVFPRTAAHGEDNGVSTITPERFNQWLAEKGVKVALCPACGSERAASFLFSAKLAKADLYGLGRGQQECVK